jgi:crotonobetainyl-CoA:carnitine CoA-transferase CaiB-like acyl-CoA transferase
VKRVENRDEITAVFDAIFVEKPVGYWLPRLAEADIPSGPINNFAQVFAEKQVLHRELEVGSPHPLDPDLKVIRNPIRYSVTPIEDYAPPPMLGEHTDEILRGWLGFDDARMAELRAAGVI